MAALRHHDRFRLKPVEHAIYSQLGLLAGQEGQVYGVRAKDEPSLAPVG